MRTVTSTPSKRRGSHPILIVATLLPSCVGVDLGVNEVPKKYSQSSKVFTKGPTTSKDLDRGTMPSKENDPLDGLRPIIPHQAAGIRIDPPVSDPRAIGTIPMATALALPLDEPPERQPFKCGLGTFPKWIFSPVNPTAHSFILVLPIGIAPRSISPCKTEAVFLAFLEYTFGLPVVVTKSSQSILSLTAKGIPQRSPHPSPLLIFASTSSANSSAPSTSRRIKVGEISESKVSRCAKLKASSTCERADREPLFTSSEIAFKEGQW